MQILNTDRPLTLGDYWAVVVRRRWWILGTAFLIWLVAFAIGFRLPAVYRSEALILIEKQSVPQNYVMPNVTIDLQERLHSISQKILSRTRLLMIIEQSNLYGGSQKRLGLDELVDQMRGDIRIELVRGGNQAVTAFRIAYSARDPRLAQQVTGELVSLFIGENQRRREEQSQRTTDFLESQLATARQRLEKQEAQLRDFKMRYLGELPEQEQANLQILNSLELQLQANDQRMNQARQETLYLESVLAQSRSSGGGLLEGEDRTAFSPVALDAELDRLSTLLRDLRSRYTEQHPDVQRTLDQIQKLEASRQKLKAEMAQRAQEEQEEDDASKAPSSSQELQVRSPMLQSQSQLRAIEFEIENRRRMEEELRKDIKKYRARVNLIPVREQQLKNVTRDYERSKEHYESLLRKRMQSELATNLERRQQGEQFRILDPPSLPTKPYKPQRERISTFGLFLGLCVGGGLGLLIESKDKSLRSDWEVAAVTGVPVLARIPVIYTVRERRRRWVKGVLQWLVGTAMFLSVCASWVFLHLYHG